MLINQGEVIEIKSQKIYFGGISDLFSKDFNVNLAMEDCPKDASVKVLLSHNPDIIDFIEKRDGIDLILSGHSHSGQIHLEPFGALLPMPVKHKWLTRGLFNLGNGTKLFITQGAGYSSTRVRIGTKAEICQITIS